MRERPIDEWWNELAPATQQWFLENPGCLIVPRTVANVVRRRAGTDADQDQHGEMKLTQHDHDFIKARLQDRKAHVREH